MRRWRWWIGMGGVLAAFLAAAPAAAQVAIDSDGGVIEHGGTGDFPLDGFPEWDGDSWVVEISGTATPCVEAGIDELVASIVPTSLGISETITLDGAAFAVTLPMPTDATGFQATCTSADGETSFSAHSEPFFSYSYGHWSAVLASVATPTGGGAGGGGDGVLAGTGAMVGSLALAGLLSVSLGVLLLHRARRIT